MTDMTNVHSGKIAAAQLNHGPLNAGDEQELTQLIFDMIQQEMFLELMKQKLVEEADFNLMDAFQMIDDKNLGWVSAP